MINLISRMNCFQVHIDNKKNEIKNRVFTKMIRNAFLHAAKTKGVHFVATRVLSPYMPENVALLAVSVIL